MEPPPQANRAGGRRLRLRGSALPIPLSNGTHFAGLPFECSHSSQRAMARFGRREGSRCSPKWYFCRG